MPSVASPLSDRLWRESRSAIRADALSLDIAIDLASEAFDVLAVYAGGFDALAHRFWRYSHPEGYAEPPTSAEVASYGGVLASYCVWLDSRIGELVSAAPPTSSILLLSDHGMETINSSSAFRASDPPSLTNSAHHRSAPAGVILASGPRFRRYVSATSRVALRTVGDVYDVLPTILALFGIPAGLDMPGEPMLELLAEAEASRVPKRIDSHDSGWSRADSTCCESERRTADELDRLRALGYVD
ncbi:MAG: alkaline phosphatase family protein [Acidobacteriota bacterium]|nr:alkaline phosphatase family protein [Acidobacteriota bacterium]